LEEEKQKSAKETELGSLLLSEHEYEVKPLVKHTLSKEFQVYYETITQSIINSTEEAIRLRSFESLSKDSGLQSLLPYFVRFINEKITQNLKNLFILNSMMWMVKCILENPNFFIEPYLHQLMPSIMTCIVGKRLCQDPLNEDHWSLREFSSLLTSEICKRYGDSYHTLQPRIAKTLLHAFLDPSKPLTTHYGAIIGLAMLGKEVIRLLLLPNVKVFSKFIEADFKGSKNDLRSMEVKKCTNLLIEIVAHYLREELESEYKLQNPHAKTVEINLRSKLREYREQYGFISEFLISSIQANQFPNRTFEFYTSLMLK
jgi:transcription initiation factor TFIID subunit 6